MLFLASASPARKQLLQDAGVRFHVKPARTRETKKGTLREAVSINARRKAAVVARQHPNAWVLAADTMIEFRGRIYGKPSSGKSALHLLARMAGRSHLLTTGIVLQKGTELVVKTVNSRVRLRNLKKAEIQAILLESKPSRFAGGYAIRRGRDPLVQRVTGSFTNVVGLPMETVLPLLRARRILS